MLLERITQIAVYCKLQEAFATAVSAARRFQTKTTTASSIFQITLSIASV